MAIAWERVVQVDASLATVPGPVQGVILAHVLRRVNAAQLGALYDDACAFLAAHHGLRYQRATSGSAGSGAVTSETVGPVSRAYALAGIGDVGVQALLSTPWGLEFLALVRSHPNCGLGLVV